MSFPFAQRMFATSVNVWTPTVILELVSRDQYRRGQPNLHGMENAADRSDSPAQQSLQLAPALTMPSLASRLQMKHIRKSSSIGSTAHSTWAWEQVRTVRIRPRYQHEQLDSIMRLPLDVELSSSSRARGGIRWIRTALRSWDPHQLKPRSVLISYANCKCSHAPHRAKQYASC